MVRYALNMKRCVKCRIDKSETEFSFRNTNTEKRHGVCKICHSEYRRNHYLENVEFYKDKARKWNKSHWLNSTFREAKKAGYSGSFQMFEIEYRLLIEKQKNCSICNIKMDKPNIDHCHSTGKVRGLLCSNCNWGLGQFKDSIELLGNAIKYLMGD